MRTTRAHIVAARRSALGRVGGIHRTRRLEDLAAPVLVAALADVGLATGDVEWVVLGNTTAGDNPARLVALTAGVPDAAPAMTVDCRCASSFEAILAALRTVELGEAEIAVAGGAEALSTAPWRIAKPRALHRAPRFLAPFTELDEAGRELPGPLAGDALLARAHGLSRSEQDGEAVRSHAAARASRMGREIVALGRSGEAARDEMVGEPDLEELASLPALDPEEGTLDEANVAEPADGAAFVVVVSDAMHTRLGRPPSLRLASSARTGVLPADAARAPIVAVRRLLARDGGPLSERIGRIELEETSAAQVLAFVRELGLDPASVNTGGGALARGHPLAASGAVLVTRLFSALARGPRDAGEAAAGTTANNGEARLGLLAQGAVGGLGCAALFEAKLHGA
jgi:acetyl-CoA C-acetyltransferase